MSPIIPCLECGPGLGPTETYHIDSSPVNDLINTNIPPSTDAQICATRRTLQELQKGLSDLDDDILQMRVAFRRMRAKRVALHNYAEAHKAVLSPLRRIPAEIMAEIFICSLPEFPCEFSHRDSPLVLERVCKRWKDIVRSTPTMWSCISVDLKEQRQDVYLQIISTCLARSAAHPLSISFKSQLHSSSDTHSEQVLALLTAQCERWHTVHIELPWRLVDRLLVVKGSIPLLHALHLSTTTYGIQDDYLERLDAISEAPKLRHLNATSDQFCNFTSILHLPWSGLTSLVIDQQIVEEIFAILQDCPNLMEFKAHISRPDSIDRLDLPKVTLLYLHSLSLVFPQPSTTGVLSTLILPALSHAFFDMVDDDVEHADIGNVDSVIDEEHVESDTDEDEDDASHRPWRHMSEPWHVRTGLDALLSQSKCSLLSLKLRAETVYFRKRDLVGCLAALPSLTELDICASVSNLLPRTLDVPLNAPLIPQLRKLVLRTRSHLFPWGLFNDFLKSRRATGGYAPLQILSIKANKSALQHNIHIGIANTLQAFKDNGVDVERIIDEAIPHILDAS